MSIPVALVRAIIKVESGGNPLASRRERDGEWSRGLMGVKDSTAARLGLADPTRLYVPAIGVDYGVRYLGLQLRRYAGEATAAAAAYNAGTARRRADGRFVNQGYVDRVLAWLQRPRRAVPVLVAAAAVLIGVLATREARRG